MALSFKEDIRYSGSPCVYYNFIRFLHQMKQINAQICKGESNSLFKFNKTVKPLCFPIKYDVFKAHVQCLKNIYFILYPDYCFYNSWRQFDTDSKYMHTCIHRRSIQKLVHMTKTFNIDC